MKLRARLLALLLSMTLPPLTGCSLILDPENCTSDDDCLPGGACQSGICIGGTEAAGGADATGGGGTGGETPDASGGTVTPDTGHGGDADQGLPADTGMGTDTGTPDAGDATVLPPDVPLATEPPTCAILSPPAEDDGLVVALTSVPVTVQVTDPDTLPAALVATLNGSPVVLDAQGTATVEQDLVEGPNTLLLEANDPENHRCTARRQVVRDTTGPTLEVTGPDGEDIGNDVQMGESPLVLHILARDANGPADVAVTARGVAVADVVGPEDDVYVATIILADGNNAIEVTATDARGNASAHQLAVFFDGQDPELNVTFPVDGQLIENNTIDVRGTVSDNLDLAAVRVSAEVSAPGHAPAMVPIQRPGADGSFRFVAVPLYNGDNTITVTARDAVRQSSMAIRVRVEAGAPVVDITDPDPAQEFITGSADVRITGTASRSVDEVDVGPPGNPQTVVPEDGEWEVLLHLPAQGTFVITAVGRTPGGRESAAVTLTVLYDDSEPTIRITRPAEGFCTAAETIQVEGDAVDLETRVPVVNIITSTETPAAVQAATNRYRADVPVEEGLDQVLTVSGENQAGLTSEDTLTFSVDRTGPVLTLARADGAWVAADAEGNIEIRGTVVDEGCGLAALPLLVNGTDTLATPEGDFMARQNRGPNPHVVVVATDIVGNTSRAEADYRVDATAPIIEDMDPPGDVALRGNNIAISARVSDAESGLDTVTIGGVEVQAVNGRFSRNVALAPGDNPVEFVATDNVGLTRTVLLHINRDTTPPVVAITSPANNANVEDKLIIEGTLTDGEDGSGVDHVTIGNVDVVPDADGRWRHVGLPLLNGAQTVTVVGFDQAGNQSAAVNVSVTVRDFGVSPTDRNGLAGATQTSWLGAADLDADGRLDLLALTDAPDGEARIFRQRADGTYEAHPLADFGLPADLRVNDAALADLNGDALFDLIVAAPGGASTVYFGDQDAGFVVSESPAYPVAGDVTGLAVGDIDRDGLLDTLFVAGADSTVRFGLVGGGASPGTLVDLGDPDLAGMSRAQLIDLNTDGVQELLAVGPGGARAWSGELDGTFTSFADVAVTFGDTAGTQLFALDTDRDRDLDVVTLGASHAVHQNTLAGAAITAFNTAESGLVAAAGDAAGGGADFDGDARDDVALFGATGVSIFGGGAAGFTARPSAPLGIAGVPASRTGLVVDIDGDGDVDLLAAGAEGVTLVRNNVTTTRAASYFYLRVLATRALDGIAPVDATGVIVYADPLAVNPPANRALVHPTTSPLVVTFGTAARADLTIQWIEKDGGGDNNISVASQRPQAAGAAPIARQPLE